MTARTAIPLVQAHQRSRCGTKAATLARLAAAGLPVPEGRVLPADLPDAGLAGSIRPLLDWAAACAPYGLIVRSSAPVEDGPTASFAGLYASQFTPAEPATLTAALRAVRGSAASAAVRAYAHTRHTTTDAPMAVLVQPALRPYAAGVLAAQHPPGHPSSWRLEAIHGLAEPLVSGRHTGEIHTPTQPTVPTDQPVLLLPGDQHELRLPPGEWVTLTAPDRPPAHAKVKTTHHGLVEFHRPAAWATRPVLTTTCRDRLLALAASAATALALPDLELEWALLGDNRLVILQARPLTAPLPATTVPVADGRPATWQGIPAAPGTGTGPAVHLTHNTHPTPQTLRGAVLLCQALQPSTVTALLHHPAAIVATTGGPLSHTAIIARELGIPCVTAVTNALHTIPPGTPLHIDGTAGTIRHAAAQPVRPADRADITGAAVLTRHPPTHRPADNRAATWLLADPDPQPAIADLTATAHHATVPIGVFQPTDNPPFPNPPPGWRDLLLPGLGRLLWPQDAGDPPQRIVVLDPDGRLLHTRTTIGGQPAAASARSPRRARPDANTT